MGKKFEKEYDVRYYETDVNRRLLLSRLTNFFDDCAVAQSEKLGIGIEFLNSKGFSWYLYQWDIKIERLPVFGERVVVRTKPEDFYNFYASRSFELFDEKENLIATAHSLWIFLDIKNKKVARIPQEIFLTYGVGENQKKNLKPLPVRGPENVSFTSEFIVSFRDFDTNFHVNQGVYIDWAIGSFPLDFLSSNFPSSLKCIYKKETNLNEKVKVYTELSGNNSFQKIVSSDNSEIFFVEMKWKNF